MQGNKNISLLQPGSWRSDVAAKLASHAIGMRTQYVVEIFAMDVDDDFKKNVENETSVSDNESIDGDPIDSTETQANTLTTWKLSHVETTKTNQFCSCSLEMTTDCVSNVSAWTFVVP